MVGNCRSYICYFVVVLEIVIFETSRNEQPSDLTWLLIFSSQELEFEYLIRKRGQQKQKESNFAKSKPSPSNPLVLISTLKTGDSSNHRLQQSN